MIASYQPSPQIQDLSERLKGVVADFKATVANEPLSDADSRRLRLAEGLVANAEGRHRKALTLVPEADAAQAEAAAEAGIEQAVKALQVRADAFYGLRQWKEAGAHYERIHKYRPDGFSAVVSAGNCLAILGKPGDAIARYDEVIAAVTPKVEHEGRKELASVLAAGLSNRGNALAALHRLPEVLEDLDRAVDIRGRQVEREGRHDLARELAGSLDNRGLVLCAGGKPAEAPQGL